MGGMWVWWLLGLALIVLVVWLVARVGGSSHENETARHESPEETLKRRYASGEIDSEEYERRLRDLRK